MNNREFRAAFRAGVAGEASAAVADIKASIALTRAVADGTDDPDEAAWHTAWAAAAEDTLTQLLPHLSDPIRTAAR